MSNNENIERYHRTLSPSLLIAVPSFLLAFVLAISVSLLLPIFLGIIAQQLVSLMNFDIAYKSWYVLILSLIWVLCLIPAMWKLLVIATTEYEFTNHRLTYSRGVLNRQRDQLEIVRIRDIATYKPFLQRIFGLGELRLDTADRSHPYLVLPGQKNVDDLKDWLHNLNVSERKRLGYREFENTN